MLSVFNRKSKTKSPGSPTSELNGKFIHLTDLTVVASVDNSSKIGDKPSSSLKVPIRLDGTVTSLHLKTEPNPSHSSSSTHFRRNGGVSVTFESTLPTQVWQASPNPSPPPPFDTSRTLKTQGCDITNNPDGKAAHKQRIAAGPGRDGTSTTVANDDWQTTLFLADTEDSSSSSDIEDVHGSVSFRSTLSISTGSSSDSGSVQRETRERRTRPTAESRCTRQPSPGISHSNSSLEIHPEEEKGSRSNAYGSDVSKPQFPHQHRSSRPMHGDDRESVHDRRRRHRKRYRETGIKPVTHTDNSATIRSCSSNSSSTSSSGMEEMEALGWDDKSIAQLTRRHANSRRNKPVAKLKTQSQEKTQSQALPSTASSSLNSKATLSPLTVRHSADITWCTESAGLQASSLFQSVNMDTFTEPPHSCLLVRKNLYRSSSSKIDGCIDYLVRQRLSQSPPVKPPSPQANMPASLMNYPTASGSIQRLAVITSDYRPCTEFEQNHHVLVVRQGDYVCILSHDLSRTSTQHQRGTPESSNSWIYVRRWCSDHLTATGPPGFVPQHYCRMLTSSEIIHLWQHTCQVASGLVASATPRNNKFLLKLKPECELTNSPHIVPTSPLGQNLATVLDGPPTNLKDKTRQSSTIVQPVPQSRTQHLVQLNNYSVPSPETSKMIKSHHLKKMLQVLPPTPSGFGSGGSIGSETEDRDSGRGPSSGSEWGSGKGGSSNVTLDRNTLIEKTFSDAGLEHNAVPQRDTGRTCDTQIGEECNLRWNIPKCAQWVNEDRIVEHYSPEQGDSAVHSPRSSKVMLQLSVPTVATSHNEHGKGDATMIATSSTDKYPPVTLTTRTNYTPVLELRSSENAPPTLYARYDVNQAADKAKEVKTSGDEPDHLTPHSQTCAAVTKVSTKQLQESEQTDAGRLERLVTSVANTVDPSYWEPYKTVLHVNENSLEKFTLV